MERRRQYWGRGGAGGVGGSGDGGGGGGGVLDTGNFIWRAVLWFYFMTLVVSKYTCPPEP